VAIYGISVCANLRSLEILLETFSCPRASHLRCVAHAFARHPRNNMHSWKRIGPLALLIILHEAERQYNEGYHPKDVSSKLVAAISIIAGYLFFLSFSRDSEATACISCTPDSESAISSRCRKRPYRALSSGCRCFAIPKRDCNIL
jgi:hypothetical protein